MHLQLESREPNVGLTFRQYVSIFAANDLALEWRSGMPGLRHLIDRRRGDNQWWVAPTNPFRHRSGAPLVDNPWKALISAHGPAPMDELQPRESKFAHDLVALADIVTATDGFALRCHYCGEAGHLQVHCPKEAYEHHLAKAMGC